MCDNQVRLAEDSLEQKLCVAIEKGSLQEVKQLVQYGADVNQQTSKSCGITPMHWACGLGDTDVHVEIVRFLLSYCGSPNVKATEGLTPVHIAASWGFINILKILINNGGNPWLEDHEGHNAWDLALQKAQWDILKYLATYMEEDVSEPREDSVDYRFNKYVGVNDLAFLYNSTLTTSSINLGFLGASAVSGNETQNNVLNNGICQSSFITVNSTLSNSVIVEEYVYKDKEKGVSLVEWKYPPLIIEETVLDATLNEAICSSKDDGDSMDSQLLIDELKLLGSNPGPITCTTKQTYLRQLYRLRKEQAKGVPSPQREGNSKELHIMLLKYPGHESDTKISSHLDRLFVTHFTCPDPGKPWREGLSKKSFNYLLLDPRVTHNLPMNETQDQAKLFAKFVASIFYVGKGKPSRPYEHLYEAIKIRSRPQGLLKVSKKIQKILDIWNESQGVISLHVFQNSLPVEAYCREAAMIETIGLSCLTNVKRGNYYGICTSWSNADKRRWGAHLIYKAFHIFLHEGERQIRPVDL